MLSTLKKALSVLLVYSDLSTVDSVSALAWLSVDWCKSDACGHSVGKDATCHHSADRIRIL